MINKVSGRPNSCCINTGSRLFVVLTAVALVVWIEPLADLRRAASLLSMMRHEVFPATRWPAQGHFANVRGQEPDTLSDADAASTPFPFVVHNVFKGETVGGANTQIMTASWNGVFLGTATAKGVAGDQRFNSCSMVKSLVGVLVLKAIADGRLENLDQSLHWVLGQHVPDVTLREVLTMTSGLTLP